MKRIEAETLEEAYEIACREYGCSFSQLKYEIIQYPSSGFLGLFTKKAVIVAAPDVDASHSGGISLDENVSKSTPREDAKPEKKSIPPSETEMKRDVTPDSVERKPMSENQIVESFFDTRESEDEEEDTVRDDIVAEVESTVRHLIDVSCFDMDTVEVSRRDKTLYIYIDGRDSALMIGREGYRYNALSYLLFNWIHARYGLFVKLEIATFLESQEEMIRNYIQPVVESVREEGRGRTRALDGILVQIALEQLREEFPDKYVAIKRNRDDRKYVVVNDFLKS
jgi:spoIIIJ-associated protein